MLYEIWIAARYLKAQRKHKGLAVSAIAGFSFLGIMLGVATLIIVMSVMNGFHQKLLEKILGINGHMFLMGVERPFHEYNEVTDLMRTIPDITFALPLIEGSAGVSSPSYQTGALVRGIREADLKQLPGLKDNALIGTLENLDSGENVVLGRQLADHLAVGIGDTISLLTAKGVATPFGVAPRIKSYKVSAIFHVGMSEIDSSLLYLSFKEAQLYFNKEGQASLIEIFLRDPEKIDHVRTLLAPLLRPYSLFMNDWRERNKTFFDALAMESEVMFLILTMIVLVATLNIISGLILLVQDKAKNIAILRTIGASRGSILRIFMLTGTSIGFLGTCAGVAVGVMVAANVESVRQFLNWAFKIHIFPADVYFLSNLPSRIDPLEVLGVAGMSIGFSLLATLYPAWRAATLDPLEVLRYE